MLSARFPPSGTTGTAFLGTDLERGVDMGVSSDNEALFCIKSGLVTYRFDVGACFYYGRVLSGSFLCVILPQGSQHTEDVAVRELARAVRKGTVSITLEAARAERKIKAA